VPAYSPTVKQPPKGGVGRGQDGSSFLFLKISAFLHNDKNTNYLRTDLVTALTGLEVNNFAHVDELMESKRLFLKKTEVAAKSGTCNEGPDKTSARD
jgi:hypothetical protein